MQKRYIKNTLGDHFTVPDSSVGKRTTKTQRWPQKKDNGEKAMKYEIEILVASVTEDNKDEIRRILNGDFYDLISYSESGGLMDEEEARTEFDKLTASAHRLDDGSIEVRIPVLVRGQEELEEDVADDDEPFYYLAESEEIDRSDFDEESLGLFSEIDL